MTSSASNFFQNFIDTAGAASAALFDGVAHFLHGEPHDLRDGTEHHPVELPRDLAAHDNVQTEWWYYTGHAETASGRQFGFELVFFKRRTDLDKFAVVPLRLIGNPYYFAHFAVTDHRTQRFRYEHRKSSNGPLDLPASASAAHYHLRLGDWSVREAGGSHHVRAALDSDIVMEASFTPVKPVVLNGENGVSFKDEGEASRYFSYTRMAAEGDILIDGKVEHFTGLAWMDREFGTWAPTERQKGWDWFSIQFDDQTELMCYQLRDSKNNISPFSSGVFVDKDGTTTRLSADQISIEPTGEWTSPGSGATYPSGWVVFVPSLHISANVQPVMKDQELDTRGSTMIVYWEGDCTVDARIGDRSVTGRSYVELVGYDRSHESPNLAAFLLGNRFGQ